MSDTIKEIRAREILSGSGKPTVEVELTTESGITTVASVPSGTSTGAYEARELYDCESRYRGFGVRKAIRNVHTIIAPALEGSSVEDQSIIDNTLISLDGTKNKSGLGANAILPVSLAVAKAGAISKQIPLYKSFHTDGPFRLPVPVATVIAGGKHSPSGLDFEDYMLLFVGFDCFSLALEALVEIRKVLEEKLTGTFGPVPDIGGALAPPLKKTTEAFDVMLQAVETVGCSGKVFLGLDVAGSDLLTDQKTKGRQTFAVEESDLQSEKRYALSGTLLHHDLLLSHYSDLFENYPLIFLEDPVDENDFLGFSRMYQTFPDKYIVGDDLFATHPERIKRGVKEKAANTLLLKVNQVGTVSEAIEAAEIARKHGMSIAVSLRSHDTNDDFIADFSMGTGAEFIKLGSPVRGERNAKYNRLLRIEEQLGPGEHFVGSDLWRSGIR